MISKCHPCVVTTGFRLGKEEATDKAVFCLANTHLLFNPKAGEVKLAQVGLLLAELHKIARKPGVCRVCETSGGCALSLEVIFVRST